MQDAVSSEGLCIEGPQDLDRVDEITSVLGICLQLVAPDMRVLWNNRYARERFPEDLRVGNRHCFERWGRASICPDCLPLVALRTGHPAEGIRQRSLPGEPMEAFRARAVPVLSPSGKVAWVLESLVRIDVLAPEADRGWHDAQLLQLTEATGGAPVVLDSEHRIVSWSPMAGSLFGYTTKEILGRHVSLLIPKEQRVTAAEVAAPLESTAQVIGQELLRKVKDGRVVPMRISGRRLLDDEGRPAGKSLLYEDLTQTHRLRSQIEAQERLVAHVTREAGQALLEVDPEGAITRWSQGAARLLSMEAEAVLGHTLDSLHVPQLGALCNSLRGPTDIQSARLSWRDDLTLEAFATPTSAAGDKGMGATIILRDISEQTRQERQMTRSEKLAAVGSLAAGLAHEIGTPLNIISATAEYLLAAENDTATVTEELEGILAETDRISKLVKDLLTFARYSPGDWVRVDPREATERVLRLVRIPLEKKAIAVEVAVPASLGPIRMEPDGLHQVLLNLLLNAAYAVPDTGGRIRIRAWQRGAPPDGACSSVTIQVEDNGPGVPPAHRERIFDPFFTTRPDGTGLGLAVCARIITVHHGDLRVSRSEMGGASFILQLPAVEESAAPPAAAQSEPGR